MSAVGDEAGNEVRVFGFSIHGVLRERASTQPNDAASLD
jgi:hypothetical protein